MKNKNLKILFVVLLILFCTLIPTACGKKKKNDKPSTPSCNHSETKYEYNSEGHWLVCASCGERISPEKIEDHTFDSNNGTKCGYCGYERTYSLETMGTELRLVLNTNVTGDFVLPEKDENGTDITCLEFYYGEDGCFHNLTSLTIPESIMKIEFSSEYSSDDESNDYFPALTTLKILSSNAYGVDENFFKHFKNLKTIYAPTAYVDIESENELNITTKGGTIITNGTVNLTNNDSDDQIVEISNIQAKVINLDESFKYVSLRYAEAEVINAKGAIEIDGVSSITKEVNAPELEFLSPYAFYDCQNLTTLVAPKLKYIGENAFQNSGIMEIVIESDEAVVICENVFDTLSVTAKSLLVSDVTIGKSLTLNLDQLILEGDNYTLNYGFYFDTNVTVNYNVVNENATSTKVYEASDSSELSSINLNIGSKVKTLTPFAIDDVKINDIKFAANGVLETISEYALAHLQVETVTLPNTVTTIGDRAFYNSDVLGEVICTGSVSLPYAAIEGCPRFKFEIEGYLKYFGTTVIGLADNSKRDFVVREGTTAISEGVFDGYEYLETIVLPSTLTTIDDHLFDGCKNLKSVTLSDKLTSIGASAFNKTAITSIVIPNTVTSIGASAFSGCYSLGSVTLPETLTTINDGTFYYCENLTTINLPKTLTSIGASAFGYCKKLGTIELPDKLITIGNGAFSNCEAVTSIVIPNTVTSIGIGAFSGCSNLESVTLPEALTTINSNMFKSCFGLKSIVLPEKLTTIEEEAFRSSGLESITLPETLTSIGKLAFAGTDIKTISIPSKVTTISSYLFDSCMSLTSITLPETLTTIGNHAFSGCYRLASINLPETLTTIGAYAFEDCYVITTINMPNSVTTLGEYAFNRCYKLTKVTISSQIEILGAYALSDCDELVEVVISEGLKIIKTNAFYRCEKLASITLPKSVKIVEDDAFTGCSTLETIESDIILPENVTDSGLYKGEVFNGLYYKGTKVVGIQDQDMTSVVFINETTGIASGIFKNNTTIKAVYIPSDLKLENETFTGCSTDARFYFEGSFQGGKGIMIDQAVMVDGIDKNLFVYSVASNAVTVVGYLGKAQEITIPSTYNKQDVTIIGEKAFANNSTIKNVIIGEKIVDIKGGAFMNCINLVRVNISSQLRMLNNLVFSGCKNLSMVNIEGDAFEIHSLNYDPTVGETPIATVVANDINLVAYLTSTYANYLWIRNLNK